MKQLTPYTLSFKMVILGLIFASLVKVKLTHSTIIQIDIQIVADTTIQISCMFSEATELVKLYKLIGNEFKALVKVDNTEEVCDVTTEIPPNAVSCKCLNRKLVSCNISDTGSSYELYQWKCATLKRITLYYSEAAVARKTGNITSTKAYPFYAPNFKQMERGTFKTTKAYVWKTPTIVTELIDLKILNSTAGFNSTNIFLETSASTSFMDGTRLETTTPIFVVQISKQSNVTITTSDVLPESNESWFSFDDKFNQKFIIISAACVVFVLVITLFVMVYRKYRTHTEAVVPFIDDTGTSLVHISGIVRSNESIDGRQFSDTDHYETIPIMSMPPMADHFPLTNETATQVNEIESVIKNIHSTNQYYELIPDTIVANEDGFNDGQETLRADLVRYEFLLGRRTDDRTQYS